MILAKVLQSWFRCLHADSPKKAALGGATSKMTDLSMYKSLLPGLVGSREPTHIAKEAAALWCYMANVQTQLEVHGDFLEIGAFHGHAASVMVKMANAKEHVVLIDISVDEPAIRKSIRHIAGTADPTIEFIESDSRVVVATRRLENRYGTFRWVHVDGEHSYGAVVNDLHLATEAITSDGVVVVDDFFNIASACVTHAVFDFLQQKSCGLRMFLCGYNKAYLAKPNAFELYRRTCGRELIEFLESVAIQATLAENAVSTEVDYRSVLERNNGIKHRGVGFMRRDFA